MLWKFYEKLRNCSNMLRTGRTYSTPYIKPYSHYCAHLPLTQAKPSPARNT